MSAHTGLHWQCQGLSGLRGLLLQRARLWVQSGCNAECWSVSISVSKISSIYCLGKKREKKASRKNTPPSSGKDSGREIALPSEGNPRKGRDQGGLSYWKTIGVETPVEGLAGFPLVAHFKQEFTNRTFWDDGNVLYLHCHSIWQLLATCGY